jgi:hypothetical protein
MKIRVWGLAIGVRSTEGAARGALTWREYPTEFFPQNDWIKIIKVEKLTPEERLNHESNIRTIKRIG